MGFISDLVKRLSGGKTEEPQKVMVNLSDLILRLNEEPEAQCSVIGKCSGEIAESRNPGLIYTAVNILAQNSRYEDAWWFTSNGNTNKVFDMYKYLPIEQKIGLADFLIGKNQLNSALDLLRDEPKADSKIKEIITNPGFYEYFPVTAVKEAVRMDDAGAAAITYANLRRGEYRWGGGEREGLMKSVVELERYYDMTSLMHEAFLGHDDEKYDLLWQEEKQMNQAIIKAMQDLLLQMTNPQVAFEAAGDILMSVNETIDDEDYNGEYRLAIESYIMAGNTKKILDAARKASVVEGDEYKVREARMGAFEGFKALLTQFNTGEQKDPSIYEALKEIFRSYDVYNENVDEAIEVAELTGDFSAVERNFYKSLEVWYDYAPKVYKKLKEHHAVDDSKVVACIEGCFKNTSNKHGFEFEPLIRMAGLVEKNLDKPLLMGVIRSIGFGKEDSALAFDYLKERNLISNEQEKELREYL